LALFLEKEASWRLGGNSEEPKRKFQGKKPSIWKFDSYSLFAL